MGAIVRPGAHTERACNTSYTLIARRMKMTCAALQAPRAHQRAHQRAHHFPKDVRYIRNGAHTILAWRAHHCWRGISSGFLRSARFSASAALSGCPGEGLTAPTPPPAGVCYACMQQTACITTCITTCITSCITKTPENLGFLRYWLDFDHLDA